MLEFDDPRQEFDKFFLTREELKDAVKRERYRVNREWRRNWGLVRRRSRQIKEWVDSGLRKEGIALGSSWQKERKAKKRTVLISEGERSIKVSEHWRGSRLISLVVNIQQDGQDKLDLSLEAPVAMKKSCNIFQEERPVEIHFPTLPVLHFEGDRTVCRDLDWGDIEKGYEGIFTYPKHVVTLLEFAKTQIIKALRKKGTTVEVI